VLVQVAEDYCDWTHWRQVNDVAAAKPGTGVVDRARGRERFIALIIVCCGTHHVTESFTPQGSSLPAYRLLRHLSPRVRPAPGRLLLILCVPPSGLERQAAGAHQPPAGAGKQVVDFNVEPVR